MPRPSVPAIIQFGSTANPASEIGQFGSYASPDYGNSLSLLMSGTAWPRGWFAETANTNRPFIQDFNAIDFVFCSYLFYLMTLGVPEYIAAMTYWTNSIIQVAGQFYISLVDNNLGNTPNLSPTQWQSGIPGMEVTGVVKAFAGVVAPTGYVICNGAALNRTAYAALFAVCGTNYGIGDGSTTFNIPDLRIRIPVGYKSGDPNFGTIGGEGGAVDHLLTGSESGIQQHNHQQTGDNGGSGSPISALNPSGGTAQTPTAQSTLTAGNSDALVAHPNLQPYVTMNYIIKT